MRYTTFSKVLVQPYNSDPYTGGTSARSEALFKIYKKDISRAGLPAWIMEHLNMIDGEVKLAKAAFDNEYNKSSYNLQTQKRTGKII